MTEPEKGQGADDSDLLEDGWGGDDAGFASEHTTVDPNLLSRLAALDAKSKSDSSAKSKTGGNKMPREKTITLDISDLMVDDDDEPGTDDEDVHEPVKTEAIEFDSIAAAIQEKTEALDSKELLAGLDAKSKAPAPAKGGGPIMGGAAVLGGVVEKNSAPVGTPLSGSSNSPAKPDKAAPAPAPAPAAPVVDAAFSAEKTQIFVSAMDDEPTRAKLNIVQGGGQQKEYLLARDRITIGRGTNNDILVPDIAISRQHCEITRQPDGSFRMRDMSSGNGTKLNGARVMDSDLFGGDRIEIGSTVLEFVITGPGASRSPGERKITYHPSEASSRASQQVAMPPPAAAPVPNYASGPSNATQTHFTMAQQPAPAAARSTNILFSLVIAAVALVFLALAVVVGAKIYLDSQQGQATVAAKSAQEYYFEGISHTKNKEWEKAEEKFTFAMEIAREERTFQVRKDAELKLEWVRQEKKNAKAVDRGQALLKAGSYLEAITKLETVNSGSPYYEEARKLIPEAKSKYAGQLVDKAQKDFDKKAYDDSDRKITLALTTKPGYQPALDLRKRIDELPKETYKRPPAVARADRTPRVKAAGGDKPRAVKEDPKAVAAVDPGTKDDTPAVKEEPTPKEDPKGKAKAPSSVVADFTPGLTLYRNKRYAEAVTYFNGIAANSEGYNAKKAKSLAGKIKQFERLYQAGSSAYASGQHDSAQKSLTNALSLDKSVSGGYYRSDITAKLAESHYQLARASFNGSNFPRAGFHCKRVLRYKPGHAGNRQLLGQLETKARALYVDAVNAKKSDPVKAKRICDGIVGMLPASSDVHKKAKKLGKEL